MPDENTPKIGSEEKGEQDETKDNSLDQDHLEDKEKIEKVRSLR